MKQTRLVCPKCGTAIMSEKEIVLNIVDRLGLQDKITQFEDGTIEFYSGWESVIFEFDENDVVKNIS